MPKVDRTRAGRSQRADGVGILELPRRRSTTTRCAGSRSMTSTSLSRTPAHRTAATIMCGRTDGPKFRAWPPTRSTCSTRSPQPYQASADPRYLEEARALADLDNEAVSRSVVGPAGRSKSTPGAVLAPIKGRLGCSVRPSDAVDTGDGGDRTEDSVGDDRRPRYDNDAKTLLAAAPDRVSAEAGTTIGYAGACAGNAPATGQ